MTDQKPETQLLKTYVALGQRDASPAVIHAVARRLFLQDSPLCTGVIFRGVTPLVCYRGALNPDVTADPSLKLTPVSQSLAFGERVDITLNLVMGNNGGGKKHAGPTPSWHDKKRRGIEGLLRYLKDRVGIAPSPSARLEEGPSSLQLNVDRRPIFANDIYSIDGLFDVLDQDLFFASLLCGAGKRKSYGFGLITILEKK